MTPFELARSPASLPCRIPLPNLEPKLAWVRETPPSTGRAGYTTIVSNLHEGTVRAPLSTVSYAIRHWHLRDCFDPVSYANQQYTVSYRRVCTVSSGAAGLVMRTERL